ncbi:hypothetical protein CYMTET_21774, partial [Cymbomonas tetramitiformis]
LAKNTFRTSQLDANIQVTLGILCLLVYEKFLSVLLKQFNVGLPPYVVGLVILSLALLASEKLASRLRPFFLPAVSFLDTWIAAIFLPYIVGAALSPIPTSDRLIKALLFVITSTVSVLSLNGLFMQACLGSLQPPSSEAVIPPTAKATSTESSTAISKANLPQTPPTASPSWASKLASKEALAFLGLSLIAAAKPLVASTTAVPAAVAYAPGFALLTLAVYKLVQLVPKRLQAVGFVPTITGGLLLLALICAFGAAELGSWNLGVQMYLSFTGSTILRLVTPAVIGLAFKVHACKSELLSNAGPILAACAVTVPSVMLSAAAASRLLDLGPQLAWGLVPRHTATAMAVPIATSLGASSGVTVAITTLVAICGWSFGRQLLDKISVKNPTARGVAVGGTYFSAGAAQLSTVEPEAAAAASVMFAMCGVLGTFLAACPPFRTLLFLIAGVPMVP